MMFVYLGPWWLLTLTLFWVPAAISKLRNPQEPVWGWVLFGLVCLPAGIVFALFEKPAGERRSYA